MKRLLLIGDPAHGFDVLGKCSPDGKHKEYLWSRQIWERLYPRLLALDYVVEFTTTSEKEPGLQKRVKAAEKIAAKYKGMVPLFISLHNDAAGDGTKWMQARGISVWTSKGRTRSDIFAAEMIKSLNVVTKNRTKMRTFSPTPQDQDFESNFTVLMGNYNAMLIECCFQDNKDDVALLQDAAFCKLLEDAIVEGIENINNLIP